MIECPPVVSTVAGVSSCLSLSEALTKRQKFDPGRALACGLGLGRCGWPPCRAQFDRVAHGRDTSGSRAAVLALPGLGWFVAGNAEGGSLLSIGCRLHGEHSARAVGGEADSRRRKNRREVVEHDKTRCAAINERSRKVLHLRPRKPNLFGRGDALVGLHVVGLGCSHGQRCPFEHKLPGCVGGRKVKLETGGGGTFGAQALDFARHLLCREHRHTVGEHNLPEK